MGYTHYMYRAPTLEPKAFRNWVEDVKAIILASELPIRGAFGDGEPELTDHVVALNGDAERDQDHETFFVERVDSEANFMRDGRAFTFCKTARKEYDVVVVATLIAAAERFGDAVEIISDGDEAEWADGVVLFERATGRDARLPIRDEEEEG